MSGKCTCQFCLSEFPPDGKEHPHECNDFVRTRNMRKAVNFQNETGESFTPDEVENSFRKLKNEFIEKTKEGLGNNSFTPGADFNAKFLGDQMRTFKTGATRDIDLDKFDYEGFLSPFVLERYAQYMHEHRKQSDGSLRDSDNWQKGMPTAAYKSSLIRHVFNAWKVWRGGVVREKIGGVFRVSTLEDCLCGILFNTQGLLYELLKQRDTKIENPEEEVENFARKGNV